jgi:hypothetical protein
MKLDVLSAMQFIAEAKRLITHTTIKNCFVKFSFSNYYVSSSDDGEVKLSEDKKDDCMCHNLQPLGMQFEDYTTCDSALEVCGIQSVNQMLDQHLTGPEGGGNCRKKKQHSWMH